MWTRADCWKVSIASRIGSSEGRSTTISGGARTSVTKEHDSWEAIDDEGHAPLSNSYGKWSVERSTFLNVCVPRGRISTDRRIGSDRQPALEMTLCLLFRGTNCYRVLNFGDNARHRTHTQSQTVAVSLPPLVWFVVVAH